MDFLPVKAIDLDAGLLEGLAIPFGGPFDGKDLTGERFTKATNFHMDWFPAGRPLLYQHGFDEDMKSVPVGRQVKATEEERGIWAEVQMDTSHEYWEQVKKLLGDGALYFSSGSVSHLVKADPQGNIREWPWVELSLTPNPANPYAIVDTGATRGYFKSVGLWLPEQVALPNIRDLPDYETLLQALKADLQIAPEETPKPDPIEGLWLDYMEAICR